MLPWKNKGKHTGAHCFEQLVFYTKRFRILSSIWKVIFPNLHRKTKAHSPCQ